MPVSPENFKDVDFVLEYVGGSNRNELNDKFKSDNVTIDSLQVIVDLCAELRKAKATPLEAASKQESAKHSVSTLEAEREARRKNEEEATRIQSAATQKDLDTSTENKIEANSNQSSSKGGLL